MKRKNKGVRVVNEEGEKKEKNKKKGKKKKGINQFGNPLAKPIPTIVQAWKCSECGAISFGENGAPPTRCSNRKTCGRLFHL